LGNALPQRERQPLGVHPARRHHLLHTQVQQAGQVARCGLLRQHHQRHVERRVRQRAPMQQRVQVGRGGGLQQQRVVVVDLQQLGDLGEVAATVHDERAERRGGKVRRRCALGLEQHVDRRAHVEAHGAPMGRQPGDWEIPSASARDWSG
jgi:hypothetical protein